MKDPFVRLSLAAAKTLDSKLHGERVYDQALRSAVDELGRAVARVEWTTARKKARPAKQAHPKCSKLDRLRKAHGKRGAKARKTMEVYDAVEQRARGVCECGCGGAFGSDLDTMPEMDHFWGRAREESVESCWMLRAQCHREKTGNKPDRKTWLKKFYTHCVVFEYSGQLGKCIDKLESERDIARAAEVSRG